jgi:hypothetical protein
MFNFTALTLAEVTKPSPFEPPSTRDWIRSTHNRVKRRMQSLSLLLGEKVRMRAVVTTNCACDSLAPPNEGGGEG